MRSGAGAAIASLGSGSRGNGTLISLGGVRLLVDCGFTLKQTRLRLARLGLVPQDLAAILVTHEHADHIHGVAPLARRYGLPVYLTHGTRRGLRGWERLDTRVFNAHAGFADRIGARDTGAGAARRARADPVRVRGRRRSRRCIDGSRTRDATRLRRSIGTATRCSWKPIMIATCCSAATIRRS